MATDTFAETRKLEGKMDALVNLLRIRSLPLLQESASFVLPMTTILVYVLLRSNLEWMGILRLMLQTPMADYHSRRDKQFKARNDVIVIRGVHDVATVKSAETRKLEGKLYALVNLVAQLATNQKPAIVTTACGIRSSNNHHTSVCPSSQQSGVD
ncbi:hypothetical protein Fmac_015318 [Flemingia macrophylla]|uniref:Uncharacterized protein n=1 Tax=Flemingia macrophylla TaxID=520843 RepID=A0ABD1ME83_9FABA